MKAQKLKNIHQDFEVKINNRVGYHNYNTEEYYFTTSTFDEVCSPFNKSKVLQVLDEAGLLNVTESDRKTCRVPLPFEKKRKRVYAVKNDILSYEANKNTGTDGTTGTSLELQGLAAVPSIKPLLGQMGQDEPKPCSLSQVSHSSKKTGTAASPVTKDAVPLSQVSHAKNLG